MQISLGSSFCLRIGRDASGQYNFVLARKSYFTLCRIFIENQYKLLLSSSYRAGYKLEGALDQFQIDVSGKVVLDSGLSTGGFTDLLLQRGATRVYGVDVGYGQVGVRNGYESERPFSSSGNLPTVQSVAGCTNGLHFGYSGSYLIWSYWYYMRDRLVFWNVQSMRVTLVLSKDRTYEESLETRMAAYFFRLL
jgi:hypothetical protein